MTTRYSIKDLEQLSGIKAHTIRAWEQRHKLIIPKRTSTNIRYYADDDLRVVLNVALLLEHGMKIGQVAKLDPQEIAMQALEASPYLGSFTHELNELKISTLAFDLGRFEAIMAYCIEKHGIHKTFREIIGDYIQELGKLWLSGCVSISQEHFVSSLIRQKLFAAIDELEVPDQPKTGTYALFLPANELHEIGILYLAYVLKERGEHVFYLGQSLPKEYLSDLLDNKKVDFLISAFTTYPEKEDLPEFLIDLEELIDKRGVKAHLTGYQFVGQELPENLPNTHIYKDLRELSESV
ncbi:MAG: HTH-type transcriptional repressor CarH [Cryomorphaceae bacterium]|nr:MAG: HTH-type transcriptional repressor CarH [Cryomorphaceae bacterium]